MILPPLFLGCGSGGSACAGSSSGFSSPERGRECAGSGRLEGFGEGANASPGAEGVRGRCGTRPGPSEDAGRVAGGKSGARSLRSGGRPPPPARRPPEGGSRAEPSRTASGRAQRGTATCLVSNHPATYAIIVVSFPGAKLCHCNSRCGFEGECGSFCRLWHD